MNCHPPPQAYYLPEVTHSKEKLNKVEQKANELSKMMLKRLGENRYYELIQSKFPQILSEVYKQIYDPVGSLKSSLLELSLIWVRNSQIRPDLRLKCGQFA